MLAEFLRIRGLLVAAVGAGALLGAAGIFLYHQLFAEKRRMLLQREVARLDLTVAEMRSELDDLRRTSHGRRGLRKVNSKNTTSAESEVDTDIDMYSAIGTEDDDEFFDFSDEDDIVRSSETEPKLLKLVEEVDRLLKGSIQDKEAAYDLLREHEKEHFNHVSFLWRLAKTCHLLGTAYGDEGDNEKKKEFIMRGFSYAERALELDECDAEAQKWFAITAGSRGDFLSTRERIEGGYLFKEHVDKALALRPDDPTLHHLLGRFKYEVASLSWVERTVAGTLFATPPTATYLEAIQDFLHAESLSPAPWKENQLLLAQCYINEGNYSEAVSWLDSATQVPVVTSEDETAEKVVQSLLLKYSSYRN